MEAADRNSGQAERERTSERRLAESKVEASQIRGRAAAESFVEASRRVGDEATAVGRQATEAVQQTLRSAMEMAIHVAERSMNQFAAAAGLPLKSAADATPRSSRNVQAIFDSSAALADGGREVQQQWLDLAKRQLQENLVSFESMLRCGNLTELAAVQFELSRRQLGNLLHASRRSSELIGKAAQDAIRSAKVEQASAPRAA